jgi:hypothetical protein
MKSGILLLVVQEWMVTAYPVGVGKHESPPKWTIEGRGDNSNAGINKPIVKGLRVIAASSSSISFVPRLRLGLRI